MVEKVCSLSPGLMRSGEYPRVKKGSDPKESFSMVFAVFLVTFCCCFCQDFVQVLIRFWSEFRGVAFGDHGIRESFILFIHIYILLF